MVYECDNCDAVLTPGVTVCPRCGQMFDEAVPADATADDPQVPVALPPPPQSRPRLIEGIGGRIAGIAAALAVLLGLGWVLVHFLAAPPPPPRPVTIPPQYALRMTAFVRTLQATGVSVEWPVFGSDTILLLTPQAHPAKPIRWDEDTYRRLAQGTWGGFALTRYESGYSDTDATDCFIIVTDPSGRVMAADFKGTLN